MKRIKSNLSSAHSILRSNIDSLTVLTVKALLELREYESLDSLEASLVVESIKRSTNALDENASLEEVSDYVESIPDSGLDGFINNIQGIYHELLAMEIENTDGDEWKIELFEDTNHPGSDAILRNTETGEVIEIQYKATTSPSIVSDHYDKNEDIPVYGPGELAAKDTRVIDDGTLYEDIRSDTIDAVDSLQNMPGDFQGLGPLTIGLTLIQIKPIIQQYMKKEITKEVAIKQITLLTGLKAAKVGAILLLLSNPVTSIPTSGFILGKLAVELHSLYRKK
jgi:hypothetical protein